MNAILRSPDMAERLTGQRTEPFGGTVAQFTACLDAEIAKWPKVVKLAGIRGD